MRSHSEPLHIVRLERGARPLVVVANRRRGQTFRSLAIGIKLAFWGVRTDLDISSRSGSITRLALLISLDELLHLVARHVELLLDFRRDLVVLEEVLNGSDNKVGTLSIRSDRIA